MVEYIDFCDKFCETEKKYRLFELEFNGVKYWKYARYYVYNIINHKLYGMNFPFWFDNKNEWKLPKYAHKYQKFTDILFHNINFSLKKDILLFAFNRRIKDGKKYISPVTDEISMKLERNHCIVEMPYCGGYYRPNPIRGIKYFDVWDGVGEKDKIYNPINRGQFRKQVLDIFEKEFDIEFTKEEKQILLTNANYYIMHHNELIKNYKRIIKKIAPKVVLYTAAHIGDMVVLTEALKEMKIPSIELLHSYAVETSVAYNYSEIGLNSALPDYIFVYSHIQKDIIKWGIPKENIRVVGWPWLEKKKNEFLINSDNKKTKKTIMFISCRNPAMLKYMEFLAKKLDFNKYEIIFKLHPTEFATWKERYHNLSDNIQVIDNNEHDINFYFAKSDIVIGIVSTALFEAAIYPVSIYILDEEMHEEMNILLKAERAVLVNDENKLLSCVTESTREQYKSDISFVVEHAVDNINNEIEKIIKEKGDDSL